MSINVPEEWRPVVGYEGIYEISDLGRVKRTKGMSGVKAGRYLKQHLRRRYLSVGLSYKDKFKSHAVHSLVGAAFIGPRPLGYHIDHVNGDKGDNRVSNLEYVTVAENNRRASMLGLRPTGERHGSRLHPEFVARGENQGNAKLTTESVLKIRHRLSQGESGRAVAKEFGIDPTTVSDIRRRKSWKHV